jgi:hypothetical protein
MRPPAQHENAPIVPKTFSAIGLAGIPGWFRTKVKMTPFPERKKNHAMLLKIQPMSPFIH